MRTSYEIPAFAGMTKKGMTGRTNWNDKKKE